MGAFDQGVRAVEGHGLDGDVQRWRDLRETLRAEILAKGFNMEINSFTQVYGNTEVDASLLQLPHTGPMSRLADARRLMDQLVGYVSDIGLLSEGYDPKSGGSRAITRRSSAISG